MAFAFRVQAVPLGYAGVLFRVDGVELTRYNTGRDVWRPYLFPVFGPSGRMVTWMTHPHDPHGHRHHYSVWLAHAQVNGLDFWSDNTNNKQVHQRFVELGDGEETARLICDIDWVADGNKPLLHERRTIAVTYPSQLPPPDSHAKPDGFWYLDIVCEFRAAKGPVLLGATPFGFLGVRVAKSMTVRDGGGKITNANGQINERETMAQPANWCDYSGWVADGVWEGIAVFDAPTNFGHPPAWHVRDDGWFCPSHFRHQAATLQPDEPMVFRYRLLLHGSGVDKAAIDQQYRRFVP